MDSARSPVTATERQVLLNLADALHKENENSIFFCNGTIQTTGVTSPVLFYSPDGSDGESRAIRISRYQERAYDMLHEASTPSAFGRDQELVMDESYRTARELLPDRFAINFDPLNPANGVLPSVASVFMAPVVANIYKLNSYVQGGFFKAHRDTPKADNHIGTPLVGIPTPFTGGELVLRREEAHSVTIGWGKAEGFSWVFFYSDVEHEIMPVMSGHRVTIAYDVFTSGAQVVPPIMGSNHLNIDLKLLPLFNLIQTQVLQNPEFLPNGGRLAFRLVHQYPLSIEGWIDNFSRALKGIDALLHQIFLEHGMQPRIVAVYPVPLIYAGLFASSFFGLQYRDKAEAGPDEFASRDKAKNTVLLTCDSFKGPTKDVDEDQEFPDFGDPASHAVQRELGGEEQADLIWCTKPTEYVVASVYMAYGNEARKQHSYVSAAMTVELPKIGEGCRTKSEE